MVRKKKGKPLPPRGPSNHPDLGPSRRGGGAQRGGRGGLRTSFVPQSSHASPFSLRDEARNTERRPDFWSSDLKLRHNKVTFVSSGGCLDGTISEPSDQQKEHDDKLSDAITQSENAMAQMNIQTDHNATTSSSDNDVRMLLEHNKDGLASEKHVPPTPSFFVDTAGSNSPFVTGLPPPVVRSSSRSSSVSSEEVILFKGRTTAPKVIESDPAIFPKIDISINRSSPSKPPAATDGKNGAELERIMPRSSLKIGNSGRLKDQYDDEVLDDYISNVQEQEGDEEFARYAASSLGRRVLGLEDGCDWAGTAMTPLSHGSLDGWDSPNINDFDAMSTSGEIVAPIEGILCRRERRSGTQYLVRYEGLEVNEARWISKSLFQSPNELNLVRLFEENLAAKASPCDEVSSDDDEEDFLDEKDLVERKIASMSDEKIARALAKQEELGLDSDKIILFDDEDAEGNQNIGGSADDTHVATWDIYANKIPPLASRSHRGGKKANIARGDFPSASVMADIFEQDPYNGFDIMDFDRPSLNKKSKGNPLNVDVDSHHSALESYLRVVWEEDRKKKGRRKQEREEQRAQGILGKKNQFKPDLSARYMEGMTILQIQDEIKAFLLNPAAQSCPFPPMEKTQRAFIHSFGGAFGLRSKSVGQGKTRFTTLIKTSSTHEYNEAAFSKVAGKMSRSFLPRADTRGGGARRRGGGGGGGGGAPPGVSYRDGEVVGATAPEIGADNKGRAMLEKMGWSHGTALGALNNKGILHPVTHVVKTSKAGLR